MKITNLFLTLSLGLVVMFTSCEKDESIFDNGMSNRNDVSADSREAVFDVSVDSRKMGRFMDKKFKELAVALRTNHLKIFEKESNDIARDIFVDNESHYYAKHIAGKIDDVSRDEIQNIIRLLAKTDDPKKAKRILYDKIKEIKSSNYNDNQKKMILGHLLAFKRFMTFVENNQDLINDSRLVRKKSWWRCCQEAFATLTDDFIGKFAVGFMPEPCLLAVAIGGTIKYFEQ